MAESWEFSADCLELTFQLRRNVRWHDGQPFTAEDVLFTYEAMINPKTPTAYKEDFLAGQERRRWWIRTRCASPTASRCAKARAELGHVDAAQAPAREGRGGRAS